MIAARAAVGAGTVGQLIYAVGGRWNSNVLVVNDRYTP
jgi:hypothetical protein